MEEYHWEVKSTGFIEADSIGEAFDEIAEDSSYVLDDQKFWKIIIQSDKEGASCYELVTREDGPPYSMANLSGTKTIKKKSDEKKI
tara:strand:- start:12495 stop:12752 length:258 start_codon:yes stop_codon:yes gene_type:complete